MKNNYSQSTIKEGFNADGFTSIQDFIDENGTTFEKDNYKVVGILTNEGKYGRSYSLAIETPKDNILLNIPKWLGVKIFDDFQDSGESVNDFFNTSLKSIKVIPTDKGNDTHNIYFY